MSGLINQYLKKEIDYNYPDLFSQSFLYFTIHYFLKFDVIKDNTMSYINIKLLLF